MAIRGECDIDLERINEHTVSNKENLNYSSLKLMQLQNLEKNCVAGLYSRLVVTCGLYSRLTQIFHGLSFMVHYEALLL
jgi:hypothetical protein